MDEQRMTYPYQQFTITTYCAEGVWWVRARVAEKDAGGDRSVTGGPWRSRAAARSAAEGFCDRGRAGTPPPDSEATSH